MQTTILGKTIAVFLVIISLRNVLIGCIFVFDSHRIVLSTIFSFIDLVCINQ